MSLPFVITNSPLALAARLMLVLCGCLLVTNVLYLFFIIHSVAPALPKDVNNFVSEVFPVIYRPVRILEANIESQDDVNVWRREVIKDTMGFNVFFCSVTGSFFLAVWIALIKCLYNENKNNTVTDNMHLSRKQAHGFRRAAAVVLLVAIVMLLWVHWYGADHYPEPPSYRIGSRTIILSNYGIYMYAVLFWVVIFFMSVSIWMIAYAQLITNLLDNKETANVMS